MISLFLMLNLYVEVGRVHIIHNNRVIVVANHRAIHVKVTEETQLIEIIQENWDDRIVNVAYCPKGLRHSNHAYLNELDERDRTKLGSPIIMMARVFYLGGKLARLELWEQPRR